MRQVVPSYRWNDGNAATRMSVSLIAHEADTKFDGMSALPAIRTVDSSQVLPRVGGSTVTVVVALTVPTRAVMVAVPGAMPVMFPLPTTAIACAELLHSTVTPLHVVGVSVARTVSVMPGRSESVGRSSVMPVTHCGTVTVAVLVRPLTVAVMVVVPAAMAVTTPLGDTVATASLLLLHVGVRPVQFVCAIAADNVVVCPIGTDAVFGDTVTPVTRHCGGGVVLLSDPPQPTRTSTTAQPRSNRGDTRRSERRERDAGAAAGTVR
jgi:hypothetical protein